MKTHIFASIILSIISYLTAAFVRWDVMWIKEIGTWTMSDRGFIVYLVLFTQAILHATICKIKEN